MLSATLESQAPFFITIPHSGEDIVEETPWLKDLPESVLMCDIDRYVDKLYEPVISQRKLKHIKTNWHRYVVDLNRFPEDFDLSSVEGAVDAEGVHPKGLHWSVTTQGNRLIHKPMSSDTHQRILKNYYYPFHDEVAKMYREIKKDGKKNIYQLDAHSMPSIGTKFHRDPGQLRDEVVISDCEGSSCSEEYKKLVIKSFEKSGFKVGYNWPYLGGRITERYGDPKNGQHAIQVELNRLIYMNEETKKIDTEKSDWVKQMISKAVEMIEDGIIKNRL